MYKCFYHAKCRQDTNFSSFSSFTALLRHCQSAPATYEYGFESDSEKERFTSLSKPDDNLIHSCDCIVDSDYFAGKI